MTAPRLITVVDYDESWPEQFRALKARFIEILGPHCQAIEHVGSTSVPGLSAKPILDIDIIVKTQAQFTACQSALEGVSYECRGDLGIAGRYAFRRVGRTEVAHNLYVCFEGSLGLRNHLVLRDHLRSHANDVRRYGELKKRLAKQFPNDIDAYCEAKTEFIVALLSLYKFGDEALSELVESNKKPPLL